MITFPLFCSSEYIYIGHIQADQIFAFNTDIYINENYTSSAKLPLVQQGYPWFSKVIHWCSKVIHWHGYLWFSKVVFGSARLSTGSARLSLVQQGYLLWVRL